jgi:hypothetical protein
MDELRATIMTTTRIVQTMDRGGDKRMRKMAMHNLSEQVQRM